MVPKKSFLQIQELNDTRSVTGLRSLPKECKVITGISWTLGPQ